METATDLLSLPHINNHNYANTTRKPSIQSIFWDQKTSKHSVENLYMIRFGFPPTGYADLDIDGSKAYRAVIEKYGKQITDYHYSWSRNTKGKCVMDVITIVLFTDLIIEINIYHSMVIFLYGKTERAKIEEITLFIKKFKNSHITSPHVRVLLESDEGLCSKSIAITNNLYNIEDHYNSDLPPVNKKLLAQLNKMNSSGVVLLHGTAGTGKTTYLKYLVSQIKKEVVIIPSGMINRLSDPETLEFLANNKNGVLLIEDAENFIVDRNNSNYSPVSDILNIADGLLSDGLFIQVICTFNTKLAQIDPAIIRKGRLIAQYEFKPLEPEKATRLSQKLGFKTTYDVPTCLTHIFNQNDEDFSLDKLAKVGY